MNKRIALFLLLLITTLTILIAEQVKSSLSKNLSVNIQNEANSISIPDYPLETKVPLKSLDTEMADTSQNNVSPYSEFIK